MPRLKKKKCKTLHYSASPTRDRVTLVLMTLRDIYVTNKNVFLCAFRVARKRCHVTLSRKLISKNVISDD